ncbi:hypothetical protein AAFC00_007122 [Neodothiora populina]|uniref:Uncharacterized protein n=1 Tax=Neodothiora populina TaxID=2781224 RepID=A0ABR3PCH5_9PEZI
MDRPPLPPRRSASSVTPTNFPPPPIHEAGAWQASHSAPPPLPLSSKPGISRTDSRDPRFYPEIRTTSTSPPPPALPRRPSSVQVASPPPEYLTHTVSAPPTLDRSLTQESAASPVAAEPSTSSTAPPQGQPGKRIARRVLVGAAKTVGRIYIGDEGVKAVERLVVGVKQREWRQEFSAQVEQGQKDGEAARANTKAYFDRKGATQQENLQKWKEKQEPQRLQLQQQREQLRLQREQQQLQREQLSINREQQRQQQVQSNPRSQTASAAASLVRSEDMEDVPIRLLERLDLHAEESTGPNDQNYQQHQRPVASSSGGPQEQIETWRAQQHDPVFTNEHATVTVTATDVPYDAPPQQYWQTYSDEQLRRPYDVVSEVSQPSVLYVAPYVEESTAPGSPSELDSGHQQPHNAYPASVVDEYPRQDQHDVTERNVHEPSLTTETASVNQRDQYMPKDSPAAHAPLTAYREMPRELSPHLTFASDGAYLVASSPPSNIPSDTAHEYFVCAECPNSSILFYDSFWFRHVDIPLFPICSYCFEHFIRGSRFEPSFQGGLELGGTIAARCMFGVPRMTELLWPLATSTSDMQIAKSYMESRVAIPSCYGVTGVNGPTSEGLKWFAPTDSAIPGFVACAACYEAFIVGTDFKRHFMQYGEIQAPEATWSCDISVPYIQKALAACSARNDWSGFVAAAKDRLNSPACAGLTAVNAKSRKWCSGVRGKLQVLACEQCYLDHVALTAFDPEFGLAPLDYSKGDYDLTCELAILPLIVALEEALVFRDLKRFWDTCQVQSKTPLCERGDLVGVTWHTLKGGCDNFDICPTCYTGVICASGLQHLFEPQKHDSNASSTRSCDFSKKSPRFSYYMKYYNVALHTPNKRKFTKFVKNVSNLPFCTKMEFQKTQFYTVVLNNDVMFVCQSCYHEAIEDSALGRYFTFSGEVGNHMCEMYSANMRTRWATVCAASVDESKRRGINNEPVMPSESAMSDFIAYRTKRLQVYKETIPIVNRIVSSIRLRGMQQQYKYAQSSFYRNLDNNMTNAMGIHYGPEPAYKTVYSSSLSGRTYETPYGVESDKYARQASSMSSLGGTDVERGTQLEMLWREWE